MIITTTVLGGFQTFVIVGRNAQSIMCDLSNKYLVFIFVELRIPILLYCRYLRHLFWLLTR